MVEEPTGQQLDCPRFISGCRKCGEPYADRMLRDSVETAPAGTSENAANCVSCVVGPAWAKLLGSLTTNTDRSALDDLRFYGESGYGFLNDGGNQPWEVQFGAERGPSRPTRAQRPQFWAVNAHLRQEVGFGGSFTA